MNYYYLNCVIPKYITYIKIMRRVSLEQVTDR